MSCGSRSTPARKESTAASARRFVAGTTDSCPWWSTSELPTISRSGSRSKRRDEAGGRPGDRCAGRRRAGRTRPLRPSTELKPSRTLFKETSHMAQDLAHDTHDTHDDHDQPPTGIKRWLFATNHKDIGTMYLVFSLIMFFIGGAMAMVIRAELFKPGPAARRSGVLQPDDHHACAGHDLRRGHARVRRSRQLDDSAADRRAGHGAAAHEQLQLLDPAVRVHDAAVHVVRAGRRAGGRLDDVSAAGAAERRLACRC